MIELPAIHKKKAESKQFKVHPVDINGNLTGRNESSINDPKEQTGGIASWFKIGTSRSRVSILPLPPQIGMVGITQTSTHAGTLETLTEQNEQRTTI